MKNAIQQLCRTVAGCTLCHGEDGIRVPKLAVPGKDQRVRLLLLGEQPDREATLGQKPIGLAHDNSLQQLRKYVEHAGLSPDEVLYATAVFCVPRDESRRVGRPSTEEARNCARHVRRLLEAVQPQLVVTLGHTALLALQHSHREWTDLRQFILNYDVGAVLEGHDFAIYPLYFPSESTLRARGERRQLLDWKRIPSILEAAERRAAAS
ncbi:MAG TPA: uracil-DNA glycosylase family protein [bacterium]|nr:uracil-DNA glycosylase family protein [bacterium]